MGAPDKAVGAAVSARSVSEGALSEGAAGQGAAGEGGANERGAVAGVRVREARPDELEAIADLIHRTYHEVHAPLLPAELTRRRTIESFRERAARWLRETRVVGPAGAPVAFCTIHGDELYQLHVSPTARGSGVARALAADAEARMREAGVTTAWLTCAIGNDRAARFYEREGWRRAGVVASEVETSDGPMTIYVWRYEKMLGPRGVAFSTGDVRVASFIDHTLLKAEATAEDIERLCSEAAEHGFAAVCVNPVWVPRCRDRLRGTPVQLATVIGFPLGANTSAVKRREAELAVEQGATELDMVIALGHARSGDWAHVARDVGAVVAGRGDALVKVIIESAALTPAQIVQACAIARDEGAHYVKTSTGLHTSGGATPEAVALMRRVVGDALGVKASGGVRDCATALRMFACGATRLGTSSGVSMSPCTGSGPRRFADLMDLPDPSVSVTDPRIAASGTLY